MYDSPLISTSPSFAHYHDTPTMIVLLPLIALLSLLGAAAVTGAPSASRDVALTSPRAAKFDHAKACGGKNFCLTCV